MVGHGHVVSSFRGERSQKLSFFLLEVVTHSSGLLRGGCRRQADHNLVVCCNSTRLYFPLTDQCFNWRSSVYRLFAHFWQLSFPCKLARKDVYCVECIVSSTFVLSAPRDYFDASLQQYIGRDVLSSCFFPLRVRC